MTLNLQYYFNVKNDTILYNLLIILGNPAVSFESPCFSLCVNYCDAFGPAAGYQFPFCCCATFSINANAGPV